MDTFWHQLRHAYVVLNTYETIQQSVALNFLKATYESLLLPYLTSEMEIVAGFTRYKSIRFQRFKRNTIDWNKLTAAFPLGTAYIQVHRESNRQRWTAPEIGGVAVSFSSDPTRTSSLEFSAPSEELYGSTDVPSAVQAKLIDIALSTFEQINGVTGFITVDYVGAVAGGCQSPYESWIGYSNVWASRELRQRTRGYYWGNFLSAGHVELLGGHSAVKQAPVAVVKQIANGYYLQLTEDMNDIDRIKLRQLKEFLRPVLLRLPMGWRMPTVEDRLQGYDFVLAE
jgi:hypothetical protein